MKIILTAIVALGLTVANAGASTVFDLRGDGKWAQTYKFSADGINLTTSTGRQNGSGVTTTKGDNLYQWRNHGLGMKSSGDDKSKEIDGKNANELVQFYFDQAVELVSITFGKVDSNDDFDFYFDDGRTFREQADDIDIPGKGKYLFSSLWIGNLFGFGADGHNDNFTIKSIEVVATITAVPLPAALPLYGGGLAILGYLGWRKRRRAAINA
ncbi:MAG: hypothetical protein COB93_01100 [Sneathiella sp.]|nr:MAG: hypothetical protein COB93_01100 [Sneathiella sp.]